MSEKTPSPKPKNHSPIHETLEQAEAKLEIQNIARWFAQSKQPKTPTHPKPNRN